MRSLDGWTTEELQEEVARRTGSQSKEIRALVIGLEIARGAVTHLPAGTIDESLLERSKQRVYDLLWSTLPGGSAEEGTGVCGAWAKHFGMKPKPGDQLFDFDRRVQKRADKVLSVLHPEHREESS
jgi:hypothetical protein